jgi:hypothetical protein
LKNGDINYDLLQLFIGKNKEKREFLKSINHDDFECFKLKNVELKELEFLEIQEKEFLGPPNSREQIYNIFYEQWSAYYEKLNSNQIELLQAKNLFQVHKNLKMNVENKINTWSTLDIHLEAKMDAKINSIAK